MAKYETSLLGRYARGHDEDGDTWGEIILVRPGDGKIIVGIASLEDGVIDEYYTDELEMFHDREAAQYAWTHREEITS